MFLGNNDVFIIETGHWIEIYDANFITELVIIDFNLTGKKVELITTCEFDKE